MIQREETIVPNPVGHEQRRPQLPAILGKQIEEIGDITRPRVSDESIYARVGKRVRAAHRGLIRRNCREDVLREAVSFLHVDDARIAETGLESMRATNVGEIVVPTGYFFRQHVACGCTSAEICHARNRDGGLRSGQWTGDVLLVPVGIRKTELIEQPGEIVLTHSSPPTWARSRK